MQWGCDEGDARAARLAWAYRTALDEVRADRLVAARLAVAGDEVVDANGWRLPAPRGVTVCALGKAAVAMAAGAARALGPLWRGGLAVTKDEPESWAPPRLQVLRGSHPLPDDRSRSAAEAVQRLVSALGTEDALLVCVSGGASSLCAAPRPPLSPAGIARRLAELLRSGAGIDAVNRERRHLLALADGRLAEATRARIATLVLSDIPELLAPDPRHAAALVGSGPTVREDGATPGPLSVVGVPATLAAALARGCGRAGLRPRPAPVTLSCEVGEAAAGIARLACATETGGPVAYVTVGEPTLRLPGRVIGRGGRAQHVALLVAARLAALRGSRRGAAVLTAASDGSDGTTDAAGAVVTAATVARARARGCLAEEARARFDAHAFHLAARSLLRTGPTGTNLLDAVLVSPV